MLIGKKVRLPYIEPAFKNLIDCTFYLLNLPVHVELRIWFNFWIYMYITPYSVQLTTPQLPLPTNAEGTMAYR